MSAPKAATVNATPLEATAIVVLCFGWFITISLMTVSGSVHSGNYGSANLLSLVVTEIVLGVPALFILHRRGYELRALLPTPTLKGCAAGLVLYLFTAIACWLAVQPFDDPSYWQPLKDLMPAERPALGAVLLLAVVNGLYEEVFLLGYLMRGLEYRGTSFAMGVSMLVRVLYHLYQGPVGAVSILVFGLLFSAFYLRWRLLWPVVFAHILADIVPFVY